MSQLNLAEKVRLLYDNIKDIKYTLATCADMSNKSLDQYDEIIAENLGGHNTANKVVSNVKIPSTTIYDPVKLDFDIKIANIYVTHNISTNIEAARADFSGSLGSIQSNYGPISTSVDLYFKGSVADMYTIHELDVDIKETLAAQPNDFEEVYRGDASMFVSHDLIFDIKTASSVPHGLNFDIMIANVVQENIN